MQYKPTEYGDEQQHIAYYDYDDAPEKLITKDQSLILKATGYKPHSDRNGETNHLYYPIPANEKPLWDALG